MGILHEDVVIIRQSEKEGESSEITINCPDKTGLGCDLCRIILFFGLSIVKGGKSNIIFWYWFWYSMSMIYALFGCLEYIGKFENWVSIS